ncbi:MULTISPECIES: hypothetical protein [Micromonospora]|uniref:Uncharacterized protein n=1 Tax=Micromonospora chalcea TaxID=1874 RepID=A0ABX9Y6Q4_MICCH|nr:MULTISPECIES: hypothetical protein [Micromonospora]EWM64649.1 hypothetical protein MCBG_01782 [Micromonospora sp. M42]MBC8989316.1 hypothetical protein [Micromonospora chalcea]MBP1782395.1 hypothetical protein [Micromonospora sp. HB375]MBQ1067927.1 hypothetical protein [Micromonospora sp. D75]MCK1806134.1 hypothetical protein [Micromonospora sp. R42106]
MLAEPTSLLDRPRPSPPLDWLTLTDAFEIACMVRCTPPPAADVRRLDPGPHRGGIAEFNREDAAHRMRQLLGRLDVPVQHELTTGGLRRRYELHRLAVPPQHRAAYANLLTTGWRQGRRELLGGPFPGASAARRLWRPRLAAAAWRAALLAGGRHVRRHCLGIRLADRDLAAVLVRSAALLEVPAALRPGAGCFLVIVPNGEHRTRITESAELAAAG